MNEIIRTIEAKQIRSDLPQFNVGDTVRVWVKDRKAQWRDSGNLYGSPRVLWHRCGTHFPHPFAPCGSC